MKDDRRQKPMPPPPQYGRRATETAAESAARNLRQLRAQTQAEHSTPKPGRNS